MWKRTKTKTLKKRSLNSPISADFFFYRRNKVRKKERKKERKESFIKCVFFFNKLMALNIASKIER